MPLVTRTGKGEKLSIAEMDGNLTYLDNRVSYASMISTLANKETVDIVDAIEGTSIPDDATESYTKTIPLSFESPTLLYVAVQAHSIGVTSAGQVLPITLGITNAGGNLNSSNPGDMNSTVRFIVTPDYTEARLSGALVISGSYVNELGQAIPATIEAPTYQQQNNILFGVYFATAKGIGYDSTSGVDFQTNSVLKSAYIDSENNLVLLLKKRASTTSATWTSLKLNVYNIS